MGGRRREGRKQGSQGGGNLDYLRKFCNILLYFAIEMGQNGGNHYEKGWEAVVKVTGRGEESTGSRSFRPPSPPPSCINILLQFSSCLPLTLVFKFPDLPLKTQLYLTKSIQNV